MAVAFSLLALSCCFVLLNGQMVFPQLNRLWGTSNVRTRWGNQNNIAWWNAFNPNALRPREEMRTCIARSQFGQMRVTFKNEESDSLNNWSFNWNRRQSLRFRAVVMPQSQFQGMYTFVVTQYSRVEDYCSSGALGDIITSNRWWDRDRVRGIVGRPIRILPGQRFTLSTLVDDLTLNELNGRGFALCSSTKLSGLRCFDPISFCCKLGRDDKDVTLGYGLGQMEFGSSQGGNGFGNGFPPASGSVGNPSNNGPLPFPPLVSGASTEPDEITMEEDLTEVGGDNGIGTLTFG